MNELDRLGIRKELVRAFVWQCSECSKEITLLNYVQMKNSIKRHMEGRHPGLETTATMVVKKG